MIFCEWESNYDKAWTQIKNKFLSAQKFEFCRCINSAVIPWQRKKK